MRFVKRFWVFLWFLVPKKILSYVVSKVAVLKISKKIIPLYINYYKVETEPIAKNLDDFSSLRDFFIRKYKEDSRPISKDEDVIISPVDGTITQLGQIKENTLLQAKGLTYSLDELLFLNHKYIKRFQDGKFITIYLSPRDYHRIHMPVTGIIQEVQYIYGSLYPVSQNFARFLPKLFVKNKRVISYIYFNSAICALVKIGALNVGSIRLNFIQDLPKSNLFCQKGYKIYNPAIKLCKGDEIGWFDFGSTILMLFENTKVSFYKDLKENHYIKMGQPLLRIIENNY